MKAQVTNRMMAAAGAALMIGSMVVPAVQAAGCNSYEAKELKFRTIEHFATGPFQAGASMLVQSVDEWNERFEEMAAAGELSLYPVDAPKVTWGEEYVIVVAMGECPTRGYDIEIEGIWQEEDRIVIGVRQVHPSGAQQATLTSPYHIVSIDAVDVSKIEICDSTAPVPHIPVVLSPPGEDRPSDSARITVTWSGLKSRVTP